MISDYVGTVGWGWLIWVAKILLFYVKDFWGRRQKETVFYECGAPPLLTLVPFRRFLVTLAHTS